MNTFYPTLHIQPNRLCLQDYLDLQAANDLQ